MEENVLEKICIILLINLVFYFKTLGYKYISDDIPSSQRPKEKNKWKNAWLVFEGHLKSTPLIDHTITLFLHAFVCVFIYTGFGANNISFIAALLFSFNPFNDQGAVWISGRGYVFSALAMLMAMTFPYIGPLLLIAATYSNAGFLSPLCFIGSDYSWFLFFLPIIWLIHWKRFKLNVFNKVKQEMFDEDRSVKPQKLILFIKTSSFYFIHSLIPIKTTFYHSYMQSMAGAGKKRSYSLNDRFFWLGLIIFGWIGWRFIFHQWDIINFGLLWWLISIAPFCNLFRLNQEIAQRYCYLPNVGLMVVLASYLQGYPLLITAWVTMFATKMWFWMDAYQDDYYVVEQSCMNSPDAWFGWHVRAMKRWEQQSYQEAVILWTMARLISPNEYKILFNLATALKLSKHDKEAEQFLELAEKNIPGGQEEEANKLISDWRKGNLSIIL